MSDAAHSEPVAPSPEAATDTPGPATPAAHPNHGGPAVGATGGSPPPSTVTAHGPPSPKPKREHSGNTLRALIEFGVVLLIAVIFFRTFVAEAYIVPTGSMAPTLVGYHKATRCPQCDFPIMVGRHGRNTADHRPDPSDDKAANDHYHYACCPNCGWDRLDLDRIGECPGDRLLVQKHIFDFRSPRRWEMAVFRNPHPKPGEAIEAFIKRIVGLPGEAVLIHDGDIFINGQIARKSLADFQALRLLVYDNNQIPKDAPTPFRWAGSDGSRWQVVEGGREFRMPEHSDERLFHWLCYQNLVRDKDAPGGWKKDKLRDLTGYNGGHALDWLVHDLMIECDLTPQGAGSIGLAVTDGYDDVLIQIPVVHTSPTVPATCHLTSAPESGARPEDASKAGLLREARFHLVEGKTYRIACGLVDRRLFVVVDGKEIFGTIDLPSVAPGRERRALDSPLSRTGGGFGPVSLASRSVGLKVSNLRLYRDIHYTGRDGSNGVAHAIDVPITLGTDEYYVLGDNSANSYDSRKWEGGPAVRHAHLVGKPFLLHLPARLTEWTWFNEKRALAVPDWSRMKILR